MRALFPRWSDTALRAALVSIVGLIVGLVAFLMIWARTPLIREQNQPFTQPAEFDHRHHVVEDGIDCLYCHGLAETSPHAGVPPASLCMNCHNQIWNEATLLEPVRRSFYENVPLRWRRVYDVPDFVYFNHAIHVNRGVGCVSCHGRVDLQARVYRVTPLTMAWCLDCHRRPELHLRPPEEVTNMTWRPDRPQLEVGLELKEGLHINPPVTNCSGCHR
jgi:hypothetical protein